MADVGIGQTLKGDQRCQLVLMAAKAALIGLVGGAFCGLAILGLPYLLTGNSIAEDLQGFIQMGSLAAVLGAPFGLLAFPICYMTIARGLPFKDVLLYAVPGTIIGEYAYSFAVGTLDLSFLSWMSWTQVYVGGLLGLGVSCFIVRIVNAFRHRVAR
jgi:hypothetical protein